MKVFATVATLAALAGAEAHTIFSTPQPRDPNVHTNINLNECGDSAAIAGTYQRGATVPLEWGRNNHHGGFVQVSVLPLAQVQGNGQAQVDQFDDPTNIIYAGCYNRGCYANQSPQGGDQFGIGGDGTDFQQNMCKGSLTVPAYLPDGDYVMKLVTFGNGDSFGVRNMAHTSYSNCHNFRVQGGAAVAAKPAGNAHIQWELKDDAIDVTNAKTGSTYASEGQCMFSGTHTHLGCRQVANQNSPNCQGAVADLARCDGTTGDTRTECLGNSNDGTTQGQPLYNYMIGLPPYHPQYSGSFILLSHTRENRIVTAAGMPGGNTGATDTPPPPPPADEEEPPADEEEPPADEEQPPVDDEQPPPVDDEQPPVGPPAVEQPPTGEQPVPPSADAPGNDEGLPMPLIIGGAAGGAALLAFAAFMAGRGGRTQTIVMQQPQPQQNLGHVL